MSNTSGPARIIDSAQEDWPPLEQFRTHLTQAGYSPLTLKGYLADWALFAHWFEMGHSKPLTLQSITPIDLREYKAHLLTVRACKPTTVNRRLIAISRFCHWATGAGLMDHNPAENTELLKVRRLTPRSLSRPEQNTLIQKVQKSGNARDVTIIQLLIGTGLRLSELAHLKCSDIELSGHKGWLCVRMSKSGKSRRIPLNRDICKVIEGYMGFPEKTGDNSLFLGQRGPLTVSGIWEIVRKYAYRAQLEHCSPHTLRHTFGKNLVDAGVSLDQVALLLGYESLDTTAIYTQPNQQDLERAVERLATK